MFSAVVCKIQASKRYVESLVLRIKEAASLKVKVSLYSCLLIAYLLRVFSRNVVLGGNCFCGKRKCENIKKTNKLCYCLGGGGEFKPLKALKKHCACSPKVGHLICI